MSVPYSGKSNVKGTPGLSGINTLSGDGVWGEANSNGGSPAGRGVVGVSNSGAGIWGDTSSGRAVVGVVRVKGDAVWGETKEGRGVVGISQGEGTGVWGDTNNGRAVVGVVRVKGDAVWGETKEGRGVVGISQRAGAGIWGENKGRGVGVVGVSADGIGVIAKSDTFEALHAESNSPANAAIAAYAANPNGIGPAIYAESRSRGPAGIFNGGLDVNGALTVNGHGAIVGQQSGDIWLNADDWTSKSVTIQVASRHISAEVALTSVFPDDDDFIGDVIIHQVVSDSGVEYTLGPVVERTGVTSITFQVFAGSAIIGGRWVINFWS